MCSRAESTLSVGAIFRFFKFNVVLNMGWCWGTFGFQCIGLGEDPKGVDWEKVPGGLIG